MVLAKVGIVFLLPMLLIFAQPDLGSSLVFPPMIFALLYISRLSEKFFLGAFALFSIVVTAFGIDIYGYSKHLEQQRIGGRRSSGGSSTTTHLYSRYTTTSVTGFNLRRSGRSRSGWHRRELECQTGKNFRRHRRSHRQGPVQWHAGPTRLPATGGGTQ